MAVPAATHFAPADRATPEKVRRLSERSLRDPVIKTVLDAVGAYVLVLNKERQAVAGNDEILDALNIEEMDSILGLRPGELLHCEYSEEGPNGCGTSYHCRPCGAVIAILAALASEEPASDECWMTMVHDKIRRAVEMRVKATRIQLGDEPVVVLVFHDISAEKRRAALEQVFLHDLRNTIASLNGWAGIQFEDDPTDAARMVLSVASRLQDELEAQHLLLSAESGKLFVRERRVPVKEILSAVIAASRKLPVASNRTIDVDYGESRASVFTDPTLLVRVLVNMVKNGLESTSAEETVTLWYEREDRIPCFFVKNPGTIPEDDALRIFRRSFTTKEGAARGLGTYSMKLLGEQYLGGRVSFSTSMDRGTVFAIRLPRDYLP